MVDFWYYIVVEVVCYHLVLASQYDGRWLPRFYFRDFKLELQTERVWPYLIKVGDSSMQHEMVRFIGIILNFSLINKQLIYFSAFILQNLSSKHRDIILTKRFLHSYDLIRILTRGSSKRQDNFMRSILLVLFGIKELEYINLIDYQRIRRFNVNSFGTFEILVWY